MLGYDKLRLNSILLEGPPTLISPPVTCDKLLGLPLPHKLREALSSTKKCLHKQCDWGALQAAPHIAWQSRHQRNRREAAGHLVMGSECEEGLRVLEREQHADTRWTARQGEVDGEELLASCQQHLQSLCKVPELVAVTVAD